MFLHHLQPHGRLLSLLILATSCMTALSRNLETEDINHKLIGTIESYMDAAANPCENFYEYACGNWSAVDEGASSHIYADMLSHLEYAYAHDLEQILDSADKNSKFQTDEIYGKIYDFYESCKQRGRVNITRYLDIVKPTDSDDWPQENDKPWSRREKWNIWTTLGKLAAYGLKDWFFTFKLDVTQHITLSKMDHSAGGTFLPRYNFIFSQFFIANNTIANSLKDFLWSDLYHLDERFGQDESAVEMTISEFHEKVEHFDLYSYLAAFFGHEEFDNITLTVYHLDYLRNVAAAIHMATQDTLIHTTKWAFLAYLNGQIWDQHWRKTCVQTAIRIVPFAMDYLYEKEIYSHKREATDEIITNIFKSMQHKFLEMIEEHADELSAAVIEALKEKMLKMNLVIGNLPQGLDDQFYVNYFRTWNVTKGEFYHNHLNALKRGHVDHYELLKLEEYAPLRPLLGGSLPSPVFLDTGNSVVIPYAYMRYPMVQSDFHELFLYAELGNTVGHEMMHGFDSERIKYDADGKTSITTSILEEPKFRAALECIQQEPTSALHEKIADFSGFRLAYETYFGHSKFPEFFMESGFTNKQLFFIKFAQFFCALREDKVDYDNSHDTPYKRVPQVVKNNPDFAETFSCPQQTGQQIVEKCILW